LSVASCPSCGAAVEFAIGSSMVVVCWYCRTLVARGDRGVEDHGKVAALIDTGSPLRVGLAGKYGKAGYRITGRTQLRHQAGGVWDEWYALFDNGAWGWLAEAQGRYYVTFPAGKTAPPLEQLQLGQRIDDLVVSEIGRAALASAEGELPWRPAAGAEYDYVDLTGPNGAFATFDYSEDAPLVFEGRETSLRELGVAGEPSHETRIAAAKIACTNCGAPLELRFPDLAERIFCPSCGTGYDVDQGKFRPLGTMRKTKGVPEPVIPLGTTGTVDGDRYVVAGFMQRSVKFDIVYYWTEYLLWNAEKGFRWLVHSDDHWSFVTPLRAGDVTDLGNALRFNGKQFRVFQEATARVSYVLGEFYWKVEVGETADTTDYIAPPEGLSKEVTTSGAQEINYSHARYATPDEIESAFGVSHLARPAGVGPMQPFKGGRLGVPWAMMVALLIAAAIALASLKPQRTVFEGSLDIAGAPPVEGGPANARIIFTPPFELSGKNVAIEGSASVDNSWLYAAGDLVKESTGALNSFELPIEYYSGVEDGERWSEGKQQRRAYISAPPQGTYVVRLEVQWPEGGTPPPLFMRVREGVFRWPYFIAALLLISVPAVFGLIRQASFEAERWKDSAHSPFGQWDAETDEEDEE